MTIKYVGPFIESYEYRITEEDILVPYIKGRKNGDGTWSILFEPTSFSINATEEEIQKWVSLLAQAMAYCAGYTFGENNHPRNAFSTKLIGCILDREDGSIEMSES